MSMSNIRFDLGWLAGGGIDNYRAQIRLLSAARIHPDGIHAVQIVHQGAVLALDAVDAGEPCGQSAVVPELDRGRISVQNLSGLLYQFVPGSPIPPCLDAADADDSGSVNGLADGLFLLNAYLVPGSPPIPPPGATFCGPDPTTDVLSCTADCP